METGFQLVLNTCPNNDCACEIAKRLVEEKLAACVNVLPGIMSIYQWQNQLHSEHEHLLIVKTRTDQYAKVEQCILSHHPYELPEIIAVPLENGFKDYLNWIDACIC